MEIYNHAKTMHPELNMPIWTEEHTTTYNYYKSSYEGDLQSQARMSAMEINSMQHPVVAVLAAQYQGRCPSYYFQTKDKKVSDTTESANANKKAMNILIKDGPDAAAKYMLESCGNDYATMRMMYG